MKAFFFVRKGLENDDEIAMVFAPTREKAEKHFYKMCKKASKRRLKRMDYFTGFEVVEKSIQEGALIVSSRFDFHPAAYKAASILKDVIVKGMRSGVLTGEFA